MTDSRWLNEYDWKFWTWPKNSQGQTLTFKIDQKYYLISVKFIHILAKFNDSCSLVWILDHVPTLRFIGANFIWSNSNPFFGFIDEVK